MLKRPQREETRVERYLNKMEKAVSVPASLVTINFQIDDNLAYLIRTACCFGFETIHVIGSIPPRKVLFNASGSLVDFITLKQYSSPSKFLSQARQNDWRLVSAELTNDSKNLFEYDFIHEGHTSIILGNETSGVPTELLMNSDVVHIPMWGKGYCLNTSQTGTAFVSEYCRQYYLKNKPY